MMIVNTVFIILLALFCLAQTAKAFFGECPDILTSEGITTLRHGQRACAPLQGGETDADKGRRFLYCSHGVVSVYPCETSLRFDTSSEVCNWPSRATCQLKGNEIVPLVTSPSSLESSQSSIDPEGTTPQTSTTTSTQKPPAVLTTSSPYTPSEGPCSSLNCQLPNCFCYGGQPNIPVQDTPQFIMLTFDDAVTPQNYESYFKNIFVDNIYQLYNPTGCPISAAFYVSHENTDYSKVMKLWQAGNEIASHTIHHILPDGNKDGDYIKAVSEIDGLRQEILKALGNQSLVDSVKGFRAPYLRLAGNVQFEVLRDYNFLYDTSVSSDEIWLGKTPLWPFTLDFLLKRCINSPCPTKVFPGLFEVIMNSWLGDNGYPCSMVDACAVGSNVFTASYTDWENLYNRNFEYFYPSKVPMPYFTHGSMFARSPASYTALVSWLKRLTTEYPDVWIVTPQQVIDWMKNPMTNGQMKSHRWGC